MARSAERCSGLSLTITTQLARWPGGVVGFVLAFGYVFRTYAKVSIIAQRATMPS